MVVSSQMGTLTIEKLNTVETSVQMWLDFCNESINSPFYRVVKEYTGDIEKAASLTLLRNYLSIFSPIERSRLESDVEYFYKYAKGFINELAPYRYSSEGYDREIRAAFISKIKTLLAAQRKEDPVHNERYIFIQTIVRFCSSLDYIIRVHDRYKQFLFRDLPLVRSNLLRFN